MATLKKFLRVGAAQMNFRARVVENVEVICGFVRRAARSKCDVLLFPECAVTGYNVDFSKVDRGEVATGLEQISAAAREGAISVIVGSPTFEGRKRFNSLMVFDRRGREQFRYRKIHLTARDAVYFERGNAVALFEIDGVPCTAMICHERRYPELVRLPVMLGAQMVFHANAGLDTLAVSKRKRNGRDGIAVRAFENQIFYVFANSVGPQGGGLWSAGDSKIVAPDMTSVALANNTDESLIHARLDLSQSGRRYAVEALSEPAFLRSHWRRMLAACRRQIGHSERRAAWHEKH